MTEPIAMGGSPRKSQDTGEQEEATGASTASTKKETRWEVGFFIRRVEETSATPPDYEDPPETGGGGGGGRHT